MSLSISREDLAESWSLSFSDIEFVTGKPVLARLGLAVQLKFFAAHGFFVQDRAAVPVDGISYLAEQLGLLLSCQGHAAFALFLSPAGKCLTSLPSKRPPPLPNGSRSLISAAETPCSCTRGLFPGAPHCL